MYIDCYMTSNPSFSRSFFVFFLSLMFMMSCGENRKNGDLEFVTLEIRGKVISVDPPKHSLTISHEEIPNYMMGMTMPFRVKDSTLLAGLQPGDSVRGTLAVSRVESWIASLTVTGNGEPPKGITAEDLVRHEVKIGETIPEFALTNQNGRRIRFSNFRGEVLAVTFIYTRCPIPEFCIRMSEHFSKLQRLLSGKKDLKGCWHLLSISFDPRFDTPTVLKRYANTYGADFSTWDFATDSLSSIQALAEKFGLTIGASEGGLIDHNLRTLLIDQNGKLVTILKGNEWTPEEVAGDIVRILGQ